MTSTAELKPWIITLIAGVILLVVGAVAGTVALAIGQYIIGTLNSTGTITIDSNQNFLSNIPSVVSPVFTIVGTSLIIVALVFIIKQLLGITELTGE